MKFQIIRDGTIIHEVEVNKHTDSLKLSMLVTTPEKPVEFEYIESNYILSIFQTNTKN